MPTTVWWNIYKTFNDPPGKQGLKCINCRYATAGASTVVGLGGVYGTYKTFMGNVYKGMGFAFLAVIGLGAAAVTLRSVKEDMKFNERFIQETMHKLGEKRSEFKANNQLDN